MRIFITGITGTLGSAVAMLHAERGDAVFGCARDENRVVEWQREHGREATAYVCCASRLGDPGSDVGRLLPSIDRVYHLAAMKHVDGCERQPSEACIQNVALMDQLASLCGGRLVFASSDKACLPSGVYGATKLLGERLVLARGGAVVRLGNLIGSSGSVFQTWRRQLELSGVVTVTDPEMTRFFMTVREAIELLADGSVPGKVVIPSNPLSVRMGDVAEALAGSSVVVIGCRPGETRHQWLTDGMSSEMAERWDVGELLKEAGLVHPAP